MKNRSKRTRNSTILNTFVRYFAQILIPQVASVVLLTGFFFSCSEVQSAKDATDQSEEINAIYGSIEANIQQVEMNKYVRKGVDEENPDGPYPADTYSIKPTGKFYMQAVYVTPKDTVWLTFVAKTESEVFSKYPKLKVFKIRPVSIDSEKWAEIRQECLRAERVFDIEDEPKGWLLEHEKELH